MTECHRTKKENEMTQQQDMVFRLRYQLLGGHYHCRLFSAQSRNHTFARLGELTVAEYEWVAFQEALKGVEFLEEERRLKG